MGFGAFKGHQKASVHGDAEWAGQRALAANGNMDGSGFYVGVVDGKRVNTHREASVLFFSRPGKGKSQTIGGSLRRESESNLLIADPAGELHKYHAEFLRGQGYIVHLLDVTRPVEKYNPMSFFRNSTPNTFQADMETFCELAVEQADPREEHFVDMTRNLLGGILAAEYRYMKQGPTLEYATKVLCVSGPSKRREYFGVIRRFDEPIINIAINAFEEAGDREKGSFATTMSRKLKPWLDMNVTEISKGDTWAWEDLLLAPEKHAIFVKGGVGQNEKASCYVRLAIGLAVQTILRNFGRTGTPLRRPLKVYADEGPLLGKCRPILIAITQMRKMGVTVFMCFQSLRQVRQLYGRDTEMISSCDSLITGGMNDIEVYEDYSKLIGDETITTHSRTKGRGGMSEGESEAPRRVAKADQLRRLPDDELVGLLSALSVKMKKNFTIKGDEVIYK